MTRFAKLSKLELMLMGTTKYVAFLRGINVSGNKTVPMKVLADLFATLGFSQIKTILNSGNVVFEAKETSASELAAKIESAIETKFGFNVPLQIWNWNEIKTIVNQNPFHPRPVNPNIHWYVTFLNNPNDKLPSSFPDGFALLKIQNQMLFSTLDRSAGKSTDFMSFLDKHFGKKVTTRNWNTLVKIAGV